MKKIFLLPFLFLTACGTLSTRPPQPAQTPSADTIIPAVPEVIVDYEALKDKLKMHIPETKLGYFERSFNTCSVGSGFSSKQNCQTMHLVIVHYRLRCRDSEGTVSEALTDADLQAISHQSIAWTLQNKTGLSTTNEDGYAEIHQVFQKSPRGQRLKLLSNNDFLYMRVNEITSVVAPSPWCN